MGLVSGLDGHGHLKRSRSWSQVDRSRPGLGLGSRASEEMRASERVRRERGRRQRQSEEIEDSEQRRTMGASVAERAKRAWCGRDRSRAKINTSQ